MLKAILLIAIVGLTLGNRFLTDEHPPLSVEMINHINSMNTTWKAGKNFESANPKLLKNLLGTILNTPEHLKLPKGEIPPIEGVPDTFDARTAWPNCESV